MNIKRELEKKTRRVRTTNVIQMEIDTCTNKYFGRKNEKSKMNLERETTKLCLPVDEDQLGI